MNTIENKKTKDTLVRILQDLSRHYISVPYRGEEEVDYGDIHKLYFKATKTLEDAHNLLSE